MRDKIIKKKISQMRDICSWLDLKNKIIIETGTGGTLKDPITYYLAGAKRTHTVDIRQHADPQKAWKIIGSYKKHLKSLASALRIPYEFVAERWDEINRIRQEKNFQKFLDVAGIYLYESKILPTDIPQNSIDIFYGASVLQRFSYKKLIKVIAQASEYLNQEGVFWHDIDNKDINSMFDKKINEYHYLRYNDFFWRLITSELYNNQNRLRQSDFLKLFKDAGFEPLYLKSHRPKDYQEKLKSVKLNRKYHNYDIDDISITNFHIYAIRSEMLKGKTPLRIVEEFDKQFHWKDRDYSN
jgi:hypothetical protein